MIRIALLGTAALGLSFSAGAQSYPYSGYGYDGYGYQGQGYYNAECDTNRGQNQVAGAVVGGIAGALLGATISGNDNDNYRRGHRYHRDYYRGRGHRYDNDGDKAAGALVGGVLGAVAGSAIAGSASSSDCQTRVYGNQPQANPRYGGMDVAPPTRQPVGRAWEQPQYQQQQQYNQYDPYRDEEPVRIIRGTGQGEYGLRQGEELYGGPPSPADNPAWSDPHYGATTTGYNAGYSAPRDTGECRTVYRGNQPATACNVGGDRWEFVD